MIDTDATLINGHYKDAIWLRSAPQVFQLILYVSSHRIVHRCRVHTCSPNVSNITVIHPIHLSHQSKTQPRCKLSTWTTLLAHPLKPFNDDLDFSDFRQLVATSHTLILLPSFDASFAFFRRRKPLLFLTRGTQQKQCPSSHPLSRGNMPRMQYRAPSFLLSRIFRYTLGIVPSSKICPSHRELIRLLITFRNEALIALVTPALALLRGIGLHTLSFQQPTIFWISCINSKPACRISPALCLVAMQSILFAFPHMRKHARIVKVNRGRTGHMSQRHVDDDVISTTSLNI